MKRKKADYVAHHFDSSAFEQYRSQRAAARRAGFDQCMQDIGLDFLCNDWQDPGVEVDKKSLLIRSLQSKELLTMQKACFPTVYTTQHTIFATHTTAVTTSCRCTIPNTMCNGALSWI